MLGGGLYNMHLQGTGFVAIISDGPPVLLEVEGESTFADPQAAITWSSGLTSSVKADVNMKTLIGRGSGETRPAQLLRQGLALDPAFGGTRHLGRGGRQRRRQQRRERPRQAARRLSPAEPGQESELSDPTKYVASTRSGSRPTGST